MDYSILVVDDDMKLAEELRNNLRDDGYCTDTAFDSGAALNKISRNIYNMIIIDIDISGIDVFCLIRKIRQRSNIPILIITRRNDDDTKLLAFESGADDFMTKPFSLVEFKIKVKAILRRSYDNPLKSAEVINSGDVAINISLRKVCVSGTPVELTSKEFDILYLLVSNPKKVYSREDLLEMIWGYDYCGDTRTVDVHIRRLREKIEQDDSNPKYILTKWGVGYYYNCKGN